VQPEHNTLYDRMWIMGSRYIISTGYRVPSVILYNERQIRELKAFCFSGVTLQSYNLGSIYVTVAVYKT